MRYKVTQLLIGDVQRYTVQTREHWWSKWHYIMDGQYPRLFSNKELKKHFKVFK